MDDSVKKLVERLAEHCPRKIGHECRTRRCFTDNGWDGKTVPIPVEAACYEWQSANTLTRLAGEREELAGATIQKERERLALILEAEALKRSPLTDNGVTQRVTYAIAARIVRRGRALTDKEKLENLMRGLEEFEDDEALPAPPGENT